MKESLDWYFNNSQTSKEEFDVIKNNKYKIYLYLSKYTFENYLDFSYIHEINNYFDKKKVVITIWN